MDFVDYEALYEDSTTYFEMIKREYEREHGKLLDFPPTVNEGDDE